MILIIFFIFLLTNVKNNNNKFILVNIDNEISLYEDNINFSNYTTDIKPIALYLPQFHEIKENNKWWGKGFTEWKNVKKAKYLYYGQHQPRIPGDIKNYLGYYELTKPEIIKKQVELAKNHGIYGFGIYYYWFSGKRLLEKPLDIFLINKDINFHFFLIWANENWTRRWDGRNKEILIKQEYKENDSINFIKDIKKYLMDDRYIKINKKYMIGLYEPFKIPKLNITINNWRKKAREYGIGELYILVTLNHYNLKKLRDIKLFEGAYQFSPRDSSDCRIKGTRYYLYSSILYKEFHNIDSDFDLYKGSMVEFDNTARKKESIIFQNYSPEQFYMINKKIVNWTKKNYKNNTNKFFFINAWNEWGEGTYLEPDEKYGYASINALSKAIFNLTYHKNIFNLTNLFKHTKVAVQIHIYYEDLIKELISKANNIPVKYDLYISTNSLGNKKIIENYIKNNSFAFRYEIQNFDNKGRDCIPLLIQLKKKIKKYKYFCHIHSKKTKFKKFGDDWRKYLLENLLGSKDIVSEYLTEFENNDNLGFIFPEGYYKVLMEYGNKLTNEDKYYINYLLRLIFKFYRIGEKIDFPIGNMFWTKVKSVYQIFNAQIFDIVPKEIGQIDGTIMHAIERIWLFLVKLNGYYYKKTFKHF